MVLLYIESLDSTTVDLSHWKNKYLSMDIILNRLKEPSTYRGLAIVAGLAGIHFAPGLETAICSAVAAVIGLIEIFRAEKKK